MTAEEIKSELDNTGYFFCEHFKARIRKQVCKDRQAAKMAPYGHLKFLQEYLAVGK